MNMLFQPKTLKQSFMLIFTTSMSAILLILAILIPSGGRGQNLKNYTKPVHQTIYLQEHDGKTIYQKYTNNETDDTITAYAVMKSPTKLLNVSPDKVYINKSKHSKIVYVKLNQYNTYHIFNYDTHIKSMDLGPETKTTLYLKTK